jgi:integrase
MPKYPGVKPLKGGRYRVRVKARDPKTGAMIDERRIVTASSPADAASKRDALRRQIEGAREEGPRLRLAACATSWMASKLPAVRASTRKVYADTLDLHILPALGNHFVDAITADDVVAWRDEQAAQVIGEGERARPVSPVTVNSRLRVLRQLLADVAHEHGLRNPAERVPSLRVPRRRAPKGLEPAELGSVLAKLRELTPKWFPIAFTAAVSGQRWGAVSALEWSQIDEARGVIRFDRAHVRGVLDDQKTSADVEVPLVPELREVLEAQRADLRRREKRRRERREPGTVVLETTAGLEGRWVFPSKRGTLMQPSSLRAPLAAACAAAGVRVISPHGLRYSFNHAAKRIASADVARSITGHTTEEMTIHYDHVTVAEKRAAVAGVVAALRPKAAGGGTSGGTPSDGSESAG